MKLVLAAPIYPPEIGGPATYAKALFEALPTQGIEVVLVKFSDARHFPKVVRHIVFGWRVFRALSRADMAIAFDPVSSGLSVMIASVFAQKPYVLKVGGDYAWEQGRNRFGTTASLDEFVKTSEQPLVVKLFRAIQYRVAASATRVIAPSEYLKKIVIAWGIAPEKISVIYNAIPYESTGMVPKSVESLARPLVVSVGRLVPWKHMDAVIDACAKSAANVSLAIVGDGPLHSALEKKAANELSNRAVLTGKLSHEETLAVMHSADIFVLNSSYEGLSHLLIEALMLGVAIIATDVGGNPEVIHHAENGLLVASGDTKALSAAIDRLAKDAALRAHLGANACNSSNRFSKEAMISATATLLGTASKTS